MEFGFQVQDDNIRILPSVFYRNRYNKFTSVTEALDDSTLLTRRENLSNDQSGGIELDRDGNSMEHPFPDSSADAILRRDRRDQSRIRREEIHCDVERELELQRDYC